MIQCRKEKISQIEARIYLISKRHGVKIQGNTGVKRDKIISMHIHGYFRNDQIIYEMWPNLKSVIHLALRLATRYIPSDICISRGTRERTSSCSCKGKYAWITQFIQTREAGEQGNGILFYFTFFVLKQKILKGI